MATITFTGVSGTLEQLPIYAKAITPSDTDIFDRGVRVYVGGAGNVACVPEGETATVVFSGLTAGSTLPVKVKQVRATSTTATLLIGIS
jgi:hypothetical protein